MINSESNENVLSSLGLGCWAIGGRDWGVQTDSDSINALKAAFDSGITHFDTAQAYGRGHSEELIGKTLQKVRSQISIASKIMYTPPEKVEVVITESLKRLRTDFLDLLYIHWPKKNANLAGMMEMLVKAKEKGLIKKIGVSNFSIEQMNDIMKAGKIDTHQLCYNLLWRWPEKTVIPFCRENNIAIVTYSTIAQGILTGKFKETIEFQPNDHRKNVVLFDEKVWPFVYEGVKKIEIISKEINRPLTECALQWVANQDGVQTILIGARNKEQVKQIVKYASSARISPDVTGKLSSISNEVIKNIPDTGNIFRWYP